MGDYVSQKAFPPFCPLRQMARIRWYKGSNHDFCAAHSTEWAPSQCLLVHWFSKGLFVLLCTWSNHTNVANEQNLEIKITLCVLDIGFNFIQSLFLDVFILACDICGHVMGWLPEHYSLPSKNSSKLKKKVVKSKYFYFLFWMSLVWSPEYITQCYQILVLWVYIAKTL